MQFFDRTLFFEADSVEWIEQPRASILERHCDVVLFVELRAGVDDVLLTCSTRHVELY